jgi:adenylosuccinate lyase
MIDRHYVTTLARYVDELASKSARIVHTGATPQLVREVAVLARTVSHLAEVSLEDAEALRLNS